MGSGQPTVGALAELPLSSFRTRREEHTYPTSSCSLYPAVGRTATGNLSCGLSHVFFELWSKYDLIWLAVYGALKQGAQVRMKQKATRWSGRVSCITAAGGDGSQAQSTCSTDEVHPFGHTTSQCRKKGATVWGQKAPEQLTPRFSQPCPQHTLVSLTPCCLPSSTPKSLWPRPAPPQQHFSQAPPSGKREAPRRLANGVGERA